MRLAGRSGRRLYHSREIPTGQVRDLERSAPAMLGGDLVDVDGTASAVRARLAELPMRQRHTLILRFFADLSVETTAEVMQCSTGTVKSQTAKGLAALRDQLAANATPATQERKTAMTTDQDLAAMVRNTIPDSELHSVDPDAIKTAASRRRARRRTVILAGLAVGAVSITGATLLTGPTPKPQAPDDSPAAANTTTARPHLRPGCPPPLIRITGALETGFLTVSTRIGAEVTIPAVVPNNPASTLVDGALVVGAPGTTMGLYITDPAARPLPPLPATDITRAENQVGRQTLRQGEPAILRFIATAPGDYPVFYLFTYQGQGKCTRGQTRPPVSGFGQVATIHVS